MPTSADMGVRPSCTSYFQIVPTGRYHRGHGDSYPGCRAPVDAQPALHLWGPLNIPWELSLGKVPIDPATRPQATEAGSLGAACPDQAGRTDICKCRKKLILEFQKTFIQCILSTGFNFN